MDPYLLSSFARINGEEGLVLSIIARAVRDALGTNPAHMADAWAYFASPTYQMHAAFLGMDWELPAVIHREIKS